MPPTKTSELKRLYKIWNKKLEDSGLENIEQPDGNLKSWHSYRWNREDNALRFNSPFREDYYRLAGHFLYDHKFENETERKMWEMHAEGIGAKEIVNALKNEANEREFTKCINENNAWLTVRRLSQLMLARFQPKASTKKT